MFYYLKCQYGSNKYKIITYTYLYSCWILIGYYRHVIYSSTCIPFLTIWNYLKNGTEDWENSEYICFEREGYINISLELKKLSVK